MVDVFIAPDAWPKYGAMNGTFSMVKDIPLSKMRFHDVLTVLPMAEVLAEDFSCGVFGENDSKGDSDGGVIDDREDRAKSAIRLSE